MKDKANPLGDAAPATLAQHADAASPLHGTVSDITERKRPEQAPLTRDAYLRAILNNVPYLVWLKDRDGRFLAVNDLFARSCGRQTAQEVIGKTDVDLWPADLANKYRADDAEVMATRHQKRTEEPIAEPTGIRWFETSKTPILDANGEVIGTTGIAQDITDRKQTERTWRESEARFRRLSEAMPDALMVAQDGKAVYANPAAARLLRAAGPEELVGLDLFAIIDPALHEPARQQMKRALGGEEQPPFENRFVRLDGSLVPVEISVSVSEWQSRPSMQVVVRDITERKRATESEARLVAILENTPDLVNIADPEGRLVYSNRAGRTMLGIDERADLSRYNLREFHDAANARVVLTEGIPTAMRDGAWTGETELMALDGHATAVSQVILVHKAADGTVAFLSTLARDITKRKQAEAERNELAMLNQLVVEVGKALAYQETLPAALRECCEILVRRLDAAFVRIWTLAKGATVLELQASAGLYTHIDGPHRHVPVGQYKIGLIAEEKQPHVSNDLIGDPRVHNQQWAKQEGMVAFAGHPLMQQNRVVGVMGMFARHPFSAATLNALSSVANEIASGIERKRAEDEQATLEAQLQQAQKMESVGRLAGGVAHDFNNMLGVILGNTELAIEQVDPAQPLHADLVEIRNAAVRSADLTRQLLAFARKQTVAPEVLDVNETVESMLKMLHRLIGENIHLRWQPRADLWPVMVDPSQIDQILANLCVNARDAIAGVGKMTIETGNRTIDEDYCAAHAGCLPGQYVLLAVSDDGCGMDKETLLHLFEPFFTTKEVGQGTGLGLATVYGIVKQNNGYINVYSEPNHGTTFRIYLPRHVGDAGQARTEGAATPAPLGLETILLVEDEPSILTLTKRMLERQGYTVLVAGTPGEAISMAQEHTSEIHLLVTDVIMPEMNGRTLAKHLLSVYPHLKRLFMSGYTANAIAHHGVLDEGVHFIQKPFSTRELAIKVRDALDAQN